MRTRTYKTWDPVDPVRTRTYKTWDPEDPVRTWIINHGTHGEDLALCKTWVPVVDLLRTLSHEMWDPMRTWSCRTC